MNFEDHSAFMDVSDSSGLFDSTSEQFSFSIPPHETASHATFDASDPPNFSRGASQNRERGSHPSYAQLHATGPPSNQNRNSGKQPAREQPQSRISNLQTTLQRVRPVQEQVDARIRVIENRMRHQEARMKSLSDTLSEVKEVLKGCESNVGAAYEASQMLIAFIEKMFPQEDTGLGEVGS
ncbi:hypothetical protein H2198_007230 [Neophaeococcomyces mojaviensis]|uniref:Uncharacterized protein n=1 Tax=Neophaeococcomyces mojaviensis TaxID=3383035 RepID=A0ACC3A0V2_9EURO|nr:hypothetical protein H2198_007230 [Knufia sp. JES_112]